MINLKRQYDLARDKAIYLMQNGQIKEYIEQLKTVNKIKKQLVPFYN